MSSNQPKHLDLYQWTAEENAELYRLIALGLDDPAIGVRMGKSAGAIRMRRQRLGIPRPIQRGYIWTDRQDARLRELWDQKMVAAQIAGTLAEEYGRPFSKNAIIGRAHRLELESRKIACLGERKPRIRTRHKVATGPDLRFAPPPPPADNHPWAPFGELTGAFCSFVQGDPRGFETLMCGLPRANGSYCDYHHWVTHQNRSQRPRAVTLAAVPGADPLVAQGPPR